MRLKGGKSFPIMPKEGENEYQRSDPLSRTGEQEGGRNPALVKTFGTTMFELTLLGKSKLDPKSAALEGKIPIDFTKESYLRTLKRDYYTCILVDFTFRGIPNKVQQGYAFGGKVEVNFRAYGLNKDELDKLNEELKKSDLNAALGLVEGATDENIENIKKEIDPKETVEKVQDDKKTMEEKDSQPSLEAKVVNGVLERIPGVKRLMDVKKKADSIKDLIQ